MKTIDLDLLAPEPVAVTLTVAGERVTLTVPTNIPLTQVMRLVRLQTSPDSDEESITEVFDIVLEVLRSANPDMTADPPISLLQLGQLVGLILGGTPDDGVETVVLDAVTGGAAGDAEPVGEGADGDSPLEQAAATASPPAKRSRKPSQRQAA